jgi:DNA polymerase III subunit gamma/tau
MAGLFDGAEASASVTPISAHGSLAVRHRPRRFADVVGQRHVTVPVRRAIAAGRLPQQLLFSGGSGLGKTTVARICAAALLCDTPVADDEGVDACGTCRSCLDVAAGVHMDVIELDAASNGRVDEIRELAARANLAPTRGSRRVYIVDEVHGLSGPGGQAFLKLLEEPPDHVVFLLATTDPDKMLYTNRSRCAEFELLPPSDAAVADHLVDVARREGLELDPAAASIIVSAADRDLGVRGALVALDKVLPVLAHDGLDPDAVAELLGEPPGSAVTSLAEAIAALDPRTALSVFGDLRHRFPARKLADRLAARFADDLVAACNAADIDIVAFEAAQVRCARFAALAAAPSDPAFVSTIADLARPAAASPVHLDGAARLRSELQEVTDDARSLVAQLNAAVPVDRDLNVPSGLPNHAVKVAVVEAPVIESTVDAEMPAGGDGADTRPPVRSSAGRAAAEAEESGPTPSQRLRELADAVAPSARLAAAVLRSGRARWDGSTLTVVFSPGSLARIGEHQHECTAAASELGFAVAFVADQS